MEEAAMMVDKCTSSGNKIEYDVFIHRNYYRIPKYKKQNITNNKKIQ